MPRPFDIASLEEAPKNRRDRVNGKAYIYCDEICIWKGYWCCKHGRIKYTCKECGGHGICEHGKRKSRCKECPQMKTSDLPNKRQHMTDTEKDVLDILVSFNGID